MKRKEPSVFEKYAHEYDLITNAAERAKPHGREVDVLIEQYHPTSVLDAGCATGLTAYLFASKGIPAIGLDRAPEMIKVARAKFSGTKLPLDFVEAAFERLPSSMYKRFDLVVCLANSISGVPTVAGLVRSLKSFRKCLADGGYLVIQMLNLASLAEHQIFPIRATRNGEILYTRFSERLGKQHQIHVIRHDLSTLPPTYEIFRHSYTNFTRTQMQAALKQSGFRSVTTYGKLDHSERFKKSSRDIVFVGRA